MTEVEQIKYIRRLLEFVETKAVDYHVTSELTGAVNSLINLLQEKGVLEKDCEES